MNSSIIETYYLIAQESTIYFGLVILIFGIIGGLLNILVFSTLETFRNNPCVFYLLIASIVNIGQLLSSLLIQILAIGFYIDPTFLSWVCKTRIFFIQFCAVISLVCMSLATIDQFMVLRYQYLSSLRSVHRNMFIACIIVIIHGIIFVFQYDTPNGVCKIINTNFKNYFSYFYFPVILGFVPIIIMSTFSLIDFFNIRTIASRQIRIERLSRDRQITAMVLIQIVFIILLTLPYVISHIYTISLQTTDEIILARYYLVNAITILFYYGSYASSFYVFYFVSKRFRKQLVYVLIDIHFKRFQHTTNNLNNNSVVPQIENQFSQHF